MYKVKKERLMYCDIDDTLVMWNVSEYQELEPISVSCYGEISHLRINQKNINLLYKFVKLGYGIIFWSQSGADWAEAVCRALKIDHLAEAFLTKPKYLLDDQPISVWMGERIWRDPKTGESI